VDSRIFSLWEKVLSIASSLVLSDEDDEPIWQYHSSEFILPNLYIV
jgi:hypothetical protein